MSCLSSCPDFHDTILHLHTKTCYQNVKGDFQKEVEHKQMMLWTVSCLTKTHLFRKDLKLGYYIIKYVKTLQDEDKRKINGLQKETETFKQCYSSMIAVYQCHNKRIKHRAKQKKLRLKHAFRKVEKIPDLLDSKSQAFNYLTVTKPIL